MVKHLSRGTLLVPLLLTFAAPLMAQVTHRTIDYGKPKVVNFTELVANEKAHPAAVPKDPIRQDVNTKALQAPSSPYVLSWFTGSTANDGYDYVNPPDASGVVGQDYLMETTSGEFRIYKRSGFLYEELPVSNLFNDTSVLYHGFYYYPRIVYDPTSQHFIICELGYDRLHSNYVISIAVTKTNDPTSAWYIYNIVTPANAPFDPQLGFNNNWVVITGWNYLSGGSGNIGNNIFVLNKQSLYSGAVGTVNSFTDPNFIYLCPTVTDDPNQNTEYLATEWNSNSGGNGIIGLATITGSANAPVYSGVHWGVGINKPWVSGTTVAPQAGSSLSIETGDSRITSCIYRNQSLWFTHMVNLPAITPTHTAIDWWQVDPVMDTVKQFGRLDDPTGTLFRYYPSMDVNAEGDMMIGFNASSKSSPVMNGYAARMASDPAGSLTIGNYITGASGAYTVQDNGSQSCLWGHFSGTASDPTNSTFWTFQESANSATNWTTVVANVEPTSQCATPAKLSAITTGADSVTLSWYPVPGATSYNIYFKNEFYPVWGTLTSTTNSYVYASNKLLPPDFKYDFQVQSVCGISADTSGWSTIDSTATSSYCASGSSNSSSEYIKAVALKTLSNTVANDGGYGDFTSGITRPALTAGSPDTITLTPAFSGSSADEFWTVYIDYGRSGVLNDASEIVASVHGSGTINAIFTIPANAAKNGFARMRIQMHRGSFITNPCAILDYGDVQDYLVRITGGTAPSGIAAMPADMEAVRSIRLSEEGAGLKVVPNPLPGAAAPTVVYTLAKQGNTSLKVLDLNGRILQQTDLGVQEPGQHSYRLNMPGGHLPAGFYILLLEQDKGIINRTRFIVQ